MKVTLSSGTESKEKIVVTSRRELTIPSYIPTVFIDADAQPEILQLFREGVEHVEIPVERQATGTSIF